MKIIDVIGKNASRQPSLPGSIWRILPDSVLLKGHNPFFVPDFPGGVSAIPVIALKMCKLGKNIPARFASRHYMESAPGVIFRAEEYAEELRKRGLPDSAAYIFDKALFIGNFLPYQLPESFSMRMRIIDTRGLNQSLTVEEASFSFSGFIDKYEEAIQSASRDNTLKIGDLVLINGEGTPLPMAEDTRLEVIADLQIPKNGNNMHKLNHGVSLETLLSINVK